MNVYSVAVNTQCRFIIILFLLLLLTALVSSRNCSIQRLDLWNVGTQTLIRSNLQTGAIVCRPKQQQKEPTFNFSIEAVAPPCVVSVHFLLTGPNGYRHSQPERSRKFLLFGGNDVTTFFGRELLAGEYTLTVTPNKNNIFRHKRIVVGFTVVELTDTDGGCPTPTPIVPQMDALRLAFPGAQGHGALSRGGRGGRVLKVTTLMDDGDSDTRVGTLRWALLTPEPRTIVFDVAGTIVLQRSIIVSGSQYSYLTIAGQTAPGDGVQIKGYEVNMHNVSHVIIRYMRFRPGLTKPNDYAKFSLMFSGDGNQAAHHIVVDHCTFSWAPDDTGLWGNVHHVSWQYNIMGEGMVHDFVIPGNNNPISRGLIVGAEDGQGDKQYNISVHHNYFVNNDQRNAYFSAVGPYEFINNVIYNWGSFGTAVRSSSGSLKINMIGNRYREGPALKTAGRYAIGIDDEFPNQQIFLQDNLDTRYRTNSSQSEWDIIGTGNLPASQLVTDYWRVNAPQRHQRLTPWPSAIVPVTILTATDLVDVVLAEVGATRPMRDSHDTKLVNDYTAGTGSIRFASSQKATDWPVLQVASPERDSDGDGMPDSWELEHDFDPRNATDGKQDRDDDGYSNLEEFLNRSNPSQAES